MSFVRNRTVVRRRRSLAVLFAAALAASAAPAALRAEVTGAASSAEFSDVRIGGDVSAFTLDNGLEVVVIPDRRAPVVTHMVWYKVGAADEEPGNSGIAHFLEHLMFKGTKEHPAGEFSKVIAELGGEENAFTSDDYTAYFQRVAKEHLETMMQFEADRMANLVLTDEVVAPERDVVLEERRMRVDNDPSARLGETLDSMLFVNHPYATPIIGWPDEMARMSKEDAIAFYDRYYTPNNAILIVAGDVTAEEVRTLAEKTYGQVARRAEPGPRQRPNAQDVPGLRTVTLRDANVKEPNVRQAWLVPSYNTAEGEEAPALDLLSQILGGGANSRLYTKLVIEDGIASSIGCWYRGTALDRSSFLIYGVPKSGRDLDDIAEAARAVIDDIVKNGVTADELERAKKTLLAQAIYAQDSQSSLARLFGAGLTSGETIEEIRAWPKRIAAVTAEDVQAVAARYLTGTPVTAYLRGPADNKS